MDALDRNDEHAFEVAVYHFKTVWLNSYDWILDFFERVPRWRKQLDRYGSSRTARLGGLRRANAAGRELHDKLCVPCNRRKR